MSLVVESLEPFFARFMNGDKVLVLLLSRVVVTCTMHAFEQKQNGDTHTERQTISIETNSPVHFGPDNGWLYFDYHDGARSDSCVSVDTSARPVSLLISPMRRVIVFYKETYFFVSEAVDYCDHQSLVHVCERGTVRPNGKYHNIVSGRSKWNSLHDVGNSEEWYQHQCCFHTFPRRNFHKKTSSLTSF